MFGEEIEDSFSRRGGKDQSHLHILRRADEMIERSCLISHLGQNSEIGSMEGLFLLNSASKLVR